MLVLREKVFFNASSFENAWKAAREAGKKARMKELMGRSSRLSEISKKVDLSPKAREVMKNELLSSSELARKVPNKPLKLKRIGSYKSPHRGTPMKNVRGYDPHAKLRNLIEADGQKFTKKSNFDIIHSPAYGVKRPMPKLNRPDGTPIQL